MIRYEVTFTRPTGTQTEYIYAASQAELERKISEYKQAYGPDLSHEVIGTRY